VDGDCARNPSIVRGTFLVGR